MSLLKAALLVAVLSSSVLGAHHAAPKSQACVPAPPIAIPDDGLYYGVQLPWGTDSPGAYAARLGKTPMVYGEYVPFPLSAESKTKLSSDIDLVKASRGKFLLTLEPHGGLEAVTDADIHDLSASLADYNARGVDVFVRFGHEMNGSWYAWGQQPAAYVNVFRRVATAVHQKAARSALVWAPNYGGGYPFGGGPYNAQPADAEFAALDSNQDGVLTMDDDPYEPYYPGDEYVDWVGLTNYHWGNAWPWGENELPEPGQFASQLTGTYTGLLGDQQGLPDFYTAYAVGHDKPLALVETSALYNVARLDGASNHDIKMEWVRQIFAPDVVAQFPRLKMLLWFEQIKFETDTGIVDWRVTSDPALRADFQAALPPYLIFASS